MAAGKVTANKPIKFITFAFFKCLAVNTWHNTMLHRAVYACVCVCVRSVYVCVGQAFSKWLWRSPLWLGHKVVAKV